MSVDKDSCENSSKSEGLAYIGIRFLQPPQAWLVTFFFPDLYVGWSHTIEPNRLPALGQLETIKELLGCYHWDLESWQSCPLSEYNNSNLTSSPLVKTCKNCKIRTSFFGISVKLSEAWRISCRSFAGKSGQVTIWLSHVWTNPSG